MNTPTMKVISVGSNEVLNFRMEMSRTELCEFSRAFCAGKGEKILSPNLVWQSDTSFGDRYVADYYQSGEKNVDTEADFNLLSTSKKLKKVKHDFGHWHGYSSYDDSCFWFRSCSGNTAIFFTDCSETVVGFFSTDDCNYFNFFLPMYEIKEEVKTPSIPRHNWDEGFIDSEE
jgi:hypothetical protein